MKQSFFILICLVFLTNVALAADVEGQDVVYNIQLKALENPDLEDYSSVKKYGFLHLEPNDDGLKRVMMGSYTSATQAEEILSKVQNKGYANAFVKSSSLDPANTVYTVQLGSYSFTSGLHFTKYAGLNELRINASKGVVKLVSGVFRDKMDAQSYRNQVAKKGHSCFVVEVNEALLLYPSNNNFHSEEILAERANKKLNSKSEPQSSSNNNNNYLLLTLEEQKKVALIDHQLHIPYKDKLILLEEYLKIKAASAEMAKLESKPKATVSTAKTSTKPTDFTAKGGSTLPNDLAPNRGLAPIRKPSFDKSTKEPPAKTAAPTKNSLPLTSSTSEGAIARTSAVETTSTYKGTTASNAKESDIPVKSRSAERPPLPAALTSKGIIVNSDFRIQVTAVKHMDPLVFSPLDPLGTFSVEQDSQGLTRVVLGNYGSHSEAREVLRVVHAKGFKNAYILLYENGFRSARVE